MVLDVKREAKHRRECIKEDQNEEEEKEVEVEELRDNDRKLDKRTEACGVEEINDNSLATELDRW